MYVKFIKSILPNPDAITSLTACAWGVQNSTRIFHHRLFSLSDKALLTLLNLSGPRCTIIHVVEKDLGVSAQIRNYFKLGSLVHLGTRSLESFSSIDHVLVEAVVSNNTA
jgi:hypothetical protein